MFSILTWAAFLQHRVEYLIVKNSISNPADFGYWETDPQANEFRQLFQPQVIEMEYRLPEIEHEARSHGLTLRAVADRQTQVPGLSRTASVWRAQAYRRNLFAEFDQVRIFSYHDRFCQTAMPQRQTAKRTRHLSLMPEPYHRRMSFAN